MSALPRVVASDVTHCQVVYGPLFLLYTVAEASTQNINKLVANFDAFASAADGPIGFVMITASSTRPPNGTDRAKLTKVWGKHSDKLQGLAVILRASGFVGSVLRSAAAAIFVIPNLGFPTKFYGEPEESVGWLSARVGVAPSLVRDALEYTLKQLADDAQVG